MVPEEQLNANPAQNTGMPAGFGANSAANLEAAAGMNPTFDDF